MPPSWCGPWPTTMSAPASIEARAKLRKNPAGSAGVLPASCECTLTTTRSDRCRASLIHSRIAAWSDSSAKVAWPGAGAARQKPPRKGKGSACSPHLRGLKDTFTAKGCEVLTAADGESGLKLALSAQPDLILLDIMLPKVNGYEICRAVRQQGLDMPIVMLTAKGQEEDIVLGLNL